MRDVAGNVRLMQLVETMPEAPGTWDRALSGDAPVAIYRCVSARIGSTTTSCIRTGCARRKSGDSGVDFARETRALVIEIGWNPR